jgi:hypothetical protein
MHITAAMFKATTGREPQDDDLERVNCPTVGKPGHSQCGWCPVHQGPRYGCGCLVATLQFGNGPCKGDKA